MAQPPELTPQYAVVNGWLVEDTGRHTCGTGPDGHYGAHEPDCGLEPLAQVEKLLDDAQHWQALQSPDLAALATALHDEVCGCGEQLTGTWSSYWLTIARAAVKVLRP